MNPFMTYIPVDRRFALAQGLTLPTVATGTAVFADISGFTPLTEGLSRLMGPRRGAEELSRQLNVVYDALIAQVDHYHGSVISFAGDAITCWFDDADGQAVARAVTCALMMQATMLTFTAVPLPDGRTISLAMKTAVATGSARRFLVGDPQQQLLDSLAGRTIDRLNIGEKLAQPGEILADTATMMALGTRVTATAWRSDPDSGARYALIGDLQPMAAPQPWGALPADLPLAVVRPWLLTAVYEREQQGSGEFLTDLRPTVALFLRFAGFDYQNDAQVEQKLNQFMSQVQTILTQYGGTLLQLTIGDKGSYLYASFGAPLAYEDDLFRAASAALDLHQLSQRLQLPPIQIGLSRGVMRAGAYGGTTRRTYGVLGDDVNLAARLMQLAKPGETLVSESVHEGLHRHFYLRAEGAVKIKGKQGLLSVFVLLRRKRPQTGFFLQDSYAIPMIGRQQALALVTLRLDEAVVGQGRVVGITAEAGMGKSRLLVEALQVANGRRLPIYSGECQSYGTNIPYLMWLPIFYQFFGLEPAAPQNEQIAHLENQITQLAPDRVAALPLLADVMGLAVAENSFTQALEPQSRYSTLEALLLACIQRKAEMAGARGEALVFLIEDLHWIDPISHDLLESVARRAANLPIFILIAYRPPDRVYLQKPRLEALSFFTRIELNELANEEVERLIGAKVKQQFGVQLGKGSPFISQIVERAQGNPFYVEELVNFLADRQVDLQDAQAMGEVALPNSLHSLILSRVDRLDEEQKLTLKVASIIGRIFSFDWLVGYYPQLGAPQVVRQNLAELARLDLTPVDQPEPELAYMFKHIVTQEVTYESLPFATRAALHEQLADFVERLPGERPLNLLAFHYERSENVGKKRHYLHKAGEAAVARFANREAIDYFAKLLALLPQKEYAARFDLLLALENLYGLLGEREKQADCLQGLFQLAAQLREGSKTAVVWLKQARFYELTGEYQQAAEAAQQVLAMARSSGMRREEAAAYLQWGRALYRQGEFGMAERCVQHAHQLAQQTDDIALRGDCVMNLGNVAWSLGQYDAALTYYEAALALRRQANDVRGESILLNNMGVLALSRNQYERAQLFYEQALRTLRVIGDRRNEAFVVGNLGLVAQQQGRYDEAATYQRHSLALRLEMADVYGEHLAKMNLGTIALYTGDFDTAVSLYDQALHHYVASGNTLGEVEVRLYWCLLLCLQGEYEAARQEGERAIAICRQRNHKAELALSLRNWGVALEGLADWRAAQAAYAEAAALQQELEALNLLVEPLAGLARVALANGRLPEAVALVEQIRGLLAQAGLAGCDEALRVYETCVQVYTAAGDATQADEMLREGVALLQLRANAIADPTLRENYLTRLPYHARLLAWSKT